MITNFAHLAGYPLLYEKAVFAEDLLVDGKDREHSLQAMSAMRGVLDLMMKELVRMCGMTDAMVLSYAPPGKADERVNLFTRIEALAKSGRIPQDSAGRLHEMRTLGNRAVHGEESVNRMDSGTAFRTAEGMYALLYEETYRFVYEYASGGGFVNYGGGGFGF